MSKCSFTLKISVFVLHNYGMFSRFGELKLSHSSNN